MGRRRNDLRNAAGLVLKMRIFVAVKDLIISFYTQKVHFSTPPAFGLCPLTSFALMTELADCKEIFIAMVVFLCFGSYIFQSNIISR